MSGVSPSASRVTTTAPRFRGDHPSQHAKGSLRFARRGQEFHGRPEQIDALSDHWICFSIHDFHSKFASLGRDRFIACSLEIEPASAGFARAESRSGRLGRRHHGLDSAGKPGLAQRALRPEERPHLEDDPVCLGVLGRETHEGA